MTVREALNHGASILAAAGIESPRREARLLLAASSGLTQAQLLADPHSTLVTPGLDLGDHAATPTGRPTLDEEILTTYERVLARRAAREPLAFILGWQEFWSLRFRVSPATLIPRADSETLIEAALAARSGVRTVLDLGTGTGCLLLAALAEFPSAFGIGTDRDPAAARLAVGNARDLGLASRAAFVCADWAAPIDGRFDLILCNPPYIEHGAIAGLMPEVGRFEPATALDGGPDGLDAYRAIVADLPRLLEPGGLAVLELGAGQVSAVSALARQAGFRRISTRKDLAGIQRAMLIKAD
ncbi:MAG: peptide chain release factor N(5)-glutamine methyltransferase [Acetobacteraceae bacterium]|nr:peptide chain release factor N(5)-glutamine methyltransferase [Acetobacteraceae bacterium]